MTVILDVLGAGQHVGKSCIVVRLGGEAEAAVVMVDAGIDAGQLRLDRFPDLRTYFGLSLQAEAVEVGQCMNQEIDALVVTHFHLDHIGFVPYITERYGYKGQVILTAPTASMARAVLLDAASWTQGIIAGVPEELAMPLTVKEISDCFDKVTSLPLNSSRTLKLLPNAGHAVVRLLGAGHVLGACQVMLYLSGTPRSSSVAVPGHTVLYSGDFTVETSKLLAGAQQEMGQPVDVLLCESTYISHVREPGLRVDIDFTATVHKALDSGHKVLVPISAVGKAQEMLEVLRREWQGQAHFPVAFAASEIFREADRLLEVYSSWTAKNEFSLDNLVESLGNRSQLTSDLVWGVVCPEQNHTRVQPFTILPYRESMLCEPGPLLLFASPATLAKGPSLAALKAWAVEPNNVIVLPGYCSPETVGALLAQGRKQLTLPDSSVLKVHAKVGSGHTSHSSALCLSLRTLTWSGSASSSVA
ncbi:MAG: uncharacterized protein KVP18_001755 [Porospora cf. gigantea A]|uniref:uncharacterized protein n=1 Tax=Porospora cf. gigantea A TaxID=2853593 RepID=UPI0035597BB2|nr:MAG: hypothetical protein KVP18_001755 [Porospora cf. gigantea A]